MTHEDAGHYAEKHKGAVVDEKIAARVREKASGDSLSCGAAHVIAGELGVVPAEVGKTMDLLEIRIEKCQLGLFGYGEKKRIVTPAKAVTPALEKAIRGGLVAGRLPCKAAWDLADRFSMKKLDLANACEKLGIKINSCQIGSF